MTARDETHKDDEQPPSDPTADAEKLLLVVRQLSQELRPHGPALGTITLDSTLDRDLGLDSLGRVELLTRMERDFDVTLPEQQVVTADTPRDLLRALQDAQGDGQLPGNPSVVELALGKAAAPEGARTLIEALQWHVEAHPDRPHIRLYSDHDEGEIITYGELWAAAQRTAADLRARDLGQGDAVVIMLNTERAYFTTFMGVLLAGGVPVTMAQLFTLVNDGSAPRAKPQ